ncbi:hypothetical protein ACQ4PT_045329 [Festuca glaucescens]
MEAEAAVLSQLQLQLLALVSDLRLTRERERAAREELHASSQDSACSLQWTLQMKDKQIAVISEKLNSHLALFNSVGKEVAAVTQVLGDMECLVGEKENVVSELKGKVQRISVLEKDFIEKLCFLGDKITSYQLELRNRARIIYELKEQLDAEKLNNKFHPQLEELKKSLLVKDEIIERLTSDKQVAMLKELHNMEIALGKFQDIFSSIGHEEVKSSSPVSECQDRQHYANKEQVESIPGSHCDPPNEHRLILVTDEAATATVECKSRIDTGSNQEQCPQSLKHSTLASPETVTETVEKPNCCHESKDIEMGNSSPKQQTNYVNPDLETENQS